MWTSRDECIEQPKDRGVSRLCVIVAQVPKNIFSFFLRCLTGKKYTETKYIMGLDETHGRKEM